MKMGHLRRVLRQHGWIDRPGKGSHEKWHDPKDIRRRITLSHSDDEEVPRYILCRVRNFFNKMT